MSKLFGFFDGKNGQDFFADNDRFYKMEMTTAMSGQNAKENALVKKRVSKDYFFEFAIIPQTAQNDLIDDISIMPAEQELAECDEAASHNLMAYGTVDCCYPEPVVGDTLDSVVAELIREKVKNEGKKVFAGFSVAGVFNNGVRQSATVGYSIYEGVLNTNGIWSFRVREDYHHPHATYQGCGIGNLLLQINERTQKPSTVHFYITVADLNGKNETAVKTINYLSVVEK